MPSLGCSFVVAIKSQAKENVCMKALHFRKLPIHEVKASGTNVLATPIRMSAMLLLVIVGKLKFSLLGPMCKVYNTFRKFYVLKLNLCSCRNQEMHKREDIQSYSVIYYSDMFRPLL